MAKGGKKRGRNGGEAWTGEDHAIRSMKKQASKQKSDAQRISQRERRTAARSHETEEKREEHKIRLHIRKTEREISKLRERLQKWDDVEEAKLEEKLRKEAEKAAEEEGLEKKKSRRLGPETWKLRGAARPAYEVNEFDIRYVDPHLEAHKDATEKAKRVRNVLVIYKGRLGDESEDGPPQPHCRNFLALLMQLGLLCMQANKQKAARAALIECMELDGTENPITAARTRLMRLYLDANRPSSARRLWEKLPNDKSVWIRYSAALVEYVSWNLLREPGSTRQSAEKLLAQAIQANVFCAYYLAYYEMFDGVMEYTDEIEDADEETLEEAIEYCNSEQFAAWSETDGALGWLQSILLRTLNGGEKVAEGGLKRSDLLWSDKLTVQEEAYEESPCINDDHEDEEASHDEVDVKMFAGMFRTAMEMLSESGEFRKKPVDPTMEAQDASDD